MSVTRFPSRGSRHIRVLALPGLDGRDAIDIGCQGGCNNDCKYSCRACC